MKSTTIAQLRLRNQRLAGSAFDTPQDAVHWLGAAQSQEYPLAKWSIGERTTGLSDAALDRALAAGAILRTHVLRPTWHFVTPADIRWMLELTAPRVLAQTASYYRKLELDDAVCTRSNGLVADALEGGRRLVRKDIATLLRDAGITIDPSRLGFLLMRAELDGLICSGGLEGRQHTYALLEERAPRVPTLDRDQALAELARRYFTSHGPATLKDYRWWSSLKAADARKGIDIIGPQLERLDVDGRSYWFAGSATVEPNDSATVHLLQAYDEYIVGYRESRHVLDVAGIAGATAAGDPPFYHAVVLDGQIAGWWRRVVERKAITIETRIARRLRARERRALEDAVDRYSRFVELPVALA